MPKILTAIAAGLSVIMLVWLRRRRRSTVKESIENER
jgi:uncharacterized protein (TIGR03382 family)